MHISLVKISEEFNNINGRHLWLGCEVVVNKGEDEKAAFKKGMDFLIEANKEASELPIIQVPARFSITQKEADKEFDFIKEKLSEFEFREDAQAYLETTDFKFTIEAKNIINNKPFKNEK